MAKKKTTRKKTTKKRASKTAELKPRTKSQIFGEIAEQTELTRREVASVFDAMTTLIKKDLGRRGPGTFTVPGLMKILKVHKPRRPARRGINPFTGEETTFKAKPAHSVVKIRALKGLKEMV
jgi:nucleoid DNA-binding protein